MWWRRPRVPFWMVVLAFLGVKSFMRGGRTHHSADFESRRQRFREKMDEAFDVWREPDTATSDSAPKDE